VILNNAKVGTGCIIAAGTVIPESTMVEPYSLWAGIPGKMKKKLEESDQEMIRRYALNYLDYLEIYLGERRGAGE
jgi:carbonic anhydrase/acetyltransferase-like protein (isoleucine patch superfamily)